MDDRNIVWTDRSYWKPLLSAVQRVAQWLALFGCAAYLLLACAVVIVGIVYLPTGLAAFAKAVLR